jgi:hypothetical protein
VYKAFNWGTGEAVAIKQIKLTDLPKSELRMMEVSLGQHYKIPLYQKLSRSICIYTSQSRLE